MSVKVLGLLLVLCTASSLAIHCFTCENESCGQIRGYVSENCGDAVKFCYNLKNPDNMSYRAGCLPYTCAELKKPSNIPNLQCSKCDSDNCNGPAQSVQGPAIGGGVTYNSVPTHSNTIVVGTAVATLFLALALY